MATTYTTPKTMIKPAYYDEFSCIGPACRNSCCQNWAIHVSKMEYTKIKGLRIYKTKEKEGGKVFKRLKDSERDNLYAEMVLREQGACPFLAKSKLCDLHKDNGHAVLPRTCRLFPRMLNIVGENLNCALSAGCEVVVEKLFAYPKGIPMKQEAFSIKGLPSQDAMGHVDSIDDHVLQPYFVELNLLSQLILTAPYGTVADRLLYLAASMEELDHLVAEDRISAVPAFIGSAMEHLSDITKYSPLEGNLNLQKHAALIMVSAAMAAEDDFVTRVQEGLGVTLSLVGQVQKEQDETLSRAEDAEPIEGAEATESNAQLEGVSTIDDKVFQGARLNFNTVLKDKEFVIANLMATWVLNMHFPLGKVGENCWDNAKLLIAVYSIFYYGIMGYMGPHGDKQDFIDATVLLSRGITHNDSRREEILKYLNTHGTDTLAHLAVLIK